jgi:hypothetical protein
MGWPKKDRRAIAAEYQSWCSGDDTIAQRNLPWADPDLRLKPEERRMYPVSLG